MNNRGFFWFIGIVVIAVVAFSFLLRNKDNPAINPATPTDIEQLPPETEGLGEGDRAVDVEESPAVDVETEVPTDELDREEANLEETSEVQAQIDTLKVRIEGAKTTVADEFKETLSALEANLSQLESQLASVQDEAADRQQELLTSINQQVQEIAQKVDVLTEAPVTEENSP